MWNLLVTFIVLVGVGLNCPAWVQFACPQDSAEHVAVPIPSDAYQWGLPNAVAQPAIIKSAGGCDVPSGTYLALAWVSVEPVGPARPTTVCQTLQSQHVLLRI